MWKLKVENQRWSLIVMWGIEGGAVGVSSLFPQLLLFFPGLSFCSLADVCVCACMHTYVFACICVCVCRHLCVSAPVCVCVHVSVCVQMRMCVSICVCACAHSYVYVHVCVGQEWRFVNFNLVKWESEGCRCGFKDTHTHIIVGDSCFSGSLCSYIQSEF